MATEPFGTDWNALGDELLKGTPGWQSVAPRPSQGALQPAVDLSPSQDAIGTDWNALGDQLLGGAPPSSTPVPAERVESVHEPAAGLNSAPGGTDWNALGDSLLAGQGALAQPQPMPAPAQKSGLYEGVLRPFAGRVVSTLMNPIGTQIDIADDMTGGHAKPFIHGVGEVVGAPFKGLGALAQTGIEAIAGTPDEKSQVRLDPNSLLGLQAPSLEQIFTREMIQRPGALLGEAISAGEGGDYFGAAKKALQAAIPLRPLGGDVPEKLAPEQDVAVPRPLQVAEAVAKPLVELGVGLPVAGGVFKGVGAISPLLERAMEIGFSAEMLMAGEEGKKQAYDLAAQHGIFDPRTVDAMMSAVSSAAFGALGLTRARAPLGERYVRPTPSRMGSEEVAAERSFLKPNVQAYNAANVIGWAADARRASGLREAADAAVAGDQPAPAVAAPEPPAAVAPVPVAAPLRPEPTGFTAAAPEPGLRAPVPNEAQGEATPQGLAGVQPQAAHGPPDIDQRTVVADQGAGKIDGLEETLADPYNVGEAVMAPARKLAPLTRALTSLTKWIGNVVGGNQSFAGLSTDADFTGVTLRDRIRLSLPTIYDRAVARASRPVFVRGADGRRTKVTLEPGTPQHDARVQREIARSIVQTLAHETVHGTIERIIKNNPRLAAEISKAAEKVRLQGREDPDFAHQLASIDAGHGEQFIAAHRRIYSTLGKSVATLRANVEKAVASGKSEVAIREMREAVDGAWRDAQHGPYEPRPDRAGAEAGGPDGGVLLAKRRGERETEERRPGLEPDAPRGVARGGEAGRNGPAEAVPVRAGQRAGVPGEGAAVRERGPEGVERLASPEDDAVARMMYVAAGQDYAKFTKAMREELPGVKPARLRTLYDTAAASRGNTGRENFDLLQKRGDRVVGAPPQITDKRSLEKLFKSMVAAAKRGEAGRLWYERSSKKILDLTQGDRSEAEKLAKMIALYSPTNPVPNNWTDALQAYNTYRRMNKVEAIRMIEAGEPIIKAGQYGRQDRQAERILFLDEGWDGAKTNNFYRNLMVLIDPQGAGAPENLGTTIDLHIMRALGYRTESPSLRQYIWADNFFQKLAPRVGPDWIGHQSQAAVWTDRKNAGVAGGPSYDFASASRENIGRLALEAVPHPTTGHPLADTLMKMPYEEREKYTKEVHDALRDENGIDEIAKALGLLRSRDISGPGVYRGEFNPGFQLEVQAPVGQGSRKTGDQFLDPAGLASIRAAAAAYGDVMRQQAVGFLRPFYSPRKADSGIAAHIGRPPTQAEMRSLYEAMPEQLRNNDGVVLTYDRNGPHLINLTGESWWEGPKVSDEDFSVMARRALDEALPKDQTGDVVSFKNYSELIDNDWSKGNASYLEGQRAAGSPDLPAAVDRVRARIEAVNGRWSERTGGAPEADRAAATEEVDKPNFARRRTDAAPAQAREDALPADSPERDENFKGWFGESKVVDEQGKPLRVYHGAGKEAGFNEFHQSEAEAYGEGSYFASDPRGAAEHVGPEGGIKPVYVRIERPWDGLTPDEGALDKLPSWGRWKDKYDWAQDAFDEEPSFRSTAIRELGYDGIIAPHDDYGKEIVAFSPQQIKSAIGNRGTFDPENPDIRYSRRREDEGKPAPTFYSQLSRVAEKLPQAMSGRDMMRYLTDPKREVKRAEMIWTGLDDFLTKNADRKITPAEVQQYLRENEVKVEEKTLGGGATDAEVRAVRRWIGGEGLHLREELADEAARGSKSAIDGLRSIGLPETLLEPFLRGAPTKFSQYQTPGGESYRELLLTLPARKPSTEGWTAEPYGMGPKGGWEVKDADGKSMGRFPDDTAAQAIERAAMFEQKAPERRRGKDFTAGHYDEPNVLAHVRFNERVDADGKRVLFVEEFQSDWAQKGRREGFGEDPETKRRLADLDAKEKSAEAEMQRLAGEHRKMLNRLGTMPERDRNDWTSETASPEYHELKAQRQAIADEYEASKIRYQTAVHDAARVRSKLSTGIPSAPFVEDTKAWSELAMKRMVRFAAENGFDKIAFTTGEMQAARYDLSKQIKTLRVEAFGDGKNRAYTIDYNAPDGSRHGIGSKTESQLADTVGKELADKIINNPKPKQVYEGLDLKVGGEGMKGFYDQIIPQVAQKLGKKFGAQVGKTRIDTGNDMLAKQTYSGPTLTMDEVAEKTRHLDDARLKEQGRSVLSAMQRGTSFEDAMGDQSHALAEAFKGNLTDLPRLSADVHSLDITPQMKQPMPLFSRRRRSTGPTNPRGPGGTGSFQIAGETKVEWAKAYFQDQMTRLKKVEKSVVEQGGRISLSPAQVAARKGGLVAAGVKRVLREVGEPVVAGLNREKASVDDLNLYMQATDAPHRNRVLLDTRGVRDGSGMTDAAAATILGAMRASGLDARLEPIAQMVHDASNAQLDLAVSGELIKQEQADALRAKWGDTYIPWRSEEIDEHQSGGNMRGGGIGVQGRETKMAHGRRTKAFSPVANVLEQYERTIARVERNKIDLALKKVIEDNPDKTLWGIDVEHKAMDGTRDDAAYAEDIAYKESGERHRITIYDKPLNDALRGIDAENLPGVLKIVGDGTRLFSRLVTTWSPPFAFTNLVRDIQDMAINMGVEHGPKLAARAAKGVPFAVRAMYRVSKDHAATGSWETFAREFSEHGGPLGWASTHTARETQAGLVRGVNAQGPGLKKLITRSAGDVGRWVEDANGAVENGTRLSVYRTLRESGVPVHKAVLAAKNMTINFETHGRGGPLANSLYAFFNANIQGAKRLKEVVIDNPTGRKVALGLMAAAAVLDARNRAASSDDNKDGTNDYDDIPEYVKARNFILMRGVGEMPLMIPMPYGFGVIFNAGRLAHAVSRGAMRPAKAAASLASVSINAFNPLGGDILSEQGFSAPGITQAMSPTMLDPFVQHATNKDWRGQDIKPEPAPGSVPKPTSERYWKNVSPTARFLAEKLNSATGGDKVSEGVISWSPEVMKHYWDFATGGLGRFAGNLVDMGASAAKGELPDLRNVPVANRFAYQPSPGLQGSKYRESMAEFELVMAQAKAYSIAGERAKLSALPKAMLKIAPKVKAIDAAVGKVRKLPDGEVKENALQGLYIQANRIFAEAQR